MTIARQREGEIGAVWFSVLLGIFVAFGGVLYGYDTGIINGILAMKYWRDLFSTGYRNRNDRELDISSSQSSLIVSILSVGTFFGALIAAPLADSIGRRLSLCVSNVVFAAGVALQTASTSIPAFTAGRCLAGLGVGIISVTIPLYQLETAPKRLRGTIVGTYQLSITLGLLIAAVVNNTTKDRNDSGSYRIPVAVQFVWAIILFTGALFLPETPRFFVKKGATDKALASLSRLRRQPTDNPSLRAELREIQSHHEYELNVGSATWADCYKGNNFKRLATSCVLQALQQLTGNSGIKNPFAITMITNCINTVSTFPGLWAVEKFGRRQLLLIGAVGMCKALVAFVCFFIFFFACTWGIGAWVVTSELFSLKVRAKCLAQSVATNWLLNWALGYATPYLVDSGPGNAALGSKVFFIWGGSCLISVFFTYFFIYETKGLSLEEVDELFGQVSSARKSTKFLPSKTTDMAEPMAIKRAASQDEKDSSQQHAEFQSVEEAI